MQETQGMLFQSLAWEDPLEEKMATHSSNLAWQTPWTKEPGGLQSTVWQRIGCNWVNWASLVVRAHTTSFSHRMHVREQRAHSS